MLAVKSLQVEFSDAGTDGTGLAPEMGGQLLLRRPFAPQARQLQILRLGPGQVGIRILLAADLTKVGKKYGELCRQTKKEELDLHVGIWGIGEKKEQGSISSFRIKTCIGLGWRVSILRQLVRPGQAACGPCVGAWQGGASYDSL